MKNYIPVRKHQHRRGATIVLFAMSFVALVALVGLVIDGGFLLATHRQVQNAADAASIAAAFEKVRGRTDTDARLAANALIDANGFDTVPDLVSGTNFHSPPLSGPFAGDSRCVEIILTVPVRSFFMHVTGVSASNNVSARAVAGFEPVAAGDGVIALDRRASPGLSIGGGARVRVNGRVVVNSEGGGVDEDNIAVAPGSGHSNGSKGMDVQVSNCGTPPSGLYAHWVDVVGGVHSGSLANIYAYAPPGMGPPVGELYPLHARALPEPDPLIGLPTPTTASGVDATDYVGNNRYRGSVSISSNNASGDISNGFVANRNSKITAANLAAGNVPDPMGDATGVSIYEGVSPEPFTVAGDVILYPGIYSQIRITGGRTFLVPGIYVLSPKNNTTNVFSVGGNVNATALVMGRGVMFYNTGNSYNPANGNPDNNDGESLPTGNNCPPPDTSFVGSFSITKSLYFSPINTSLYTYEEYYNNARPVSAEFDGMLFYQRRRNDEPFSITGNAGDGLLTGTIYAKWANFKLAGSGAFDAQFICGSVNVTGNGDISIVGAGNERGRANQVFLME